MEKSQSRESQRIQSQTKRENEMSVILKHPPVRKVPKGVLENKTALHLKHIAVCTVCGYGFITKGTYRRTCWDSYCVMEHHSREAKKHHDHQMKTNPEYRKRLYLQHKKWKEQHPEKVHQHRVKYYAKHRSQRIKAAVQWAKDHSERRKEITKKYRETHKDVIRERGRKWRKNSREKKKCQ